MIDWWRHLINKPYGLFHTCCKARSHRNVARLADSNIFWRSFLRPPRLVLQLSALDLNGEVKIDHSNSPIFHFEPSPVSADRCLIVVVHHHRTTSLEPKALSCSILIHITQGKRFPFITTQVSIMMMILQFEHTPYTHIYL